MERSNLLNMLKISIKSLIEASMRAGRTLTDDHPQLQQFLILMEHTFKHRIKSQSLNTHTPTPISPLSLPLSLTLLQANAAY